MNTALRIHNSPEGRKEKSPGLQPWTRSFNVFQTQDQLRRSEIFIAAPTTICRSYGASAHLGIDGYKDFAPTEHDDDLPSIQNTGL
jgi:hypothetical protein